MAQQQKNAVQTDTGTGRLKETTYGEQYSRQRLGDDWQARGLKRWQYVRGLQQGMPVLGGPTDQLGANPDRYKPVTSCMESLDCHCGE